MAPEGLTMHRALTIQELVCLIAGEVDGKHALRALALTCRAFHEPALDGLWFFPNDGLVNLVKVLPTDLWEVAGISETGQETLTVREPTRPTTQLDWERFDFYAHRIRGLDVVTKTNNLKTSLAQALSANLFHWLVSARPSHRLLPNLTSLEWKAEGDSGYDDSAYMLVGPHLVKLTLDLHDPWEMSDEHSSAVLLRYAQRCPDIRDMCFVAPRHGDPIQGGVFAPFKMLTTLTLRSPLTHDVLVDLSTLPKLADLEVDLTLTSDIEDEIIVPGRVAVSFSSPNLTFRRLVSLDLNMPVDVANTVISPYRFPQLEDISLKAHRATNAVTLEETFELIREHCNHNGLEAIRIDGGEYAQDYEIGVHGQAITAASLTSLCVFRHLRVLDICIEAHIVLNDNAVKEMAMSWPQLEVLSLVSMAKYPWATPSPPGTTLVGLAHLARYCPSLRRLTMDVDTHRLDTVPDPVKLGDGFRNRVLERIEIPEYPALGSCAKIGAFLHAIFPKLQWIIGLSDREHKSWAIVQEVIGGIRLASEWEKGAGSQVA
ncbi:uncharacterized protein C8Q71DRAFT_859688 [Rhodofomes roseus]|uniref:F-box domain-containing protein n=1 Tax=Rhodofomes roseus TaxID=34475 RepID=A0ABQ8K9S4_9APHY|nr:uncharacterized protein C8Q71DRAFT_859688 [Rhodofomes roseus]KAH9834014.1 hypothetical protein C8Q71DRAFT_859688 [Rhodofomes roseus]